jgi:purine nucleosidase/pyrimidine-specific ribonucleoside hydrolase
MADRPLPASPARRKAILDVDPGHDDAVAILLAAASPALELLAITAVAGNQTLEKTALNARRVCSVAGIRDVPVAAGCDRPLVRPLRTAGNIHGETGLDGPVFAGEPEVPLDPRHAVDLIVELALAHPGEVTLIPVGPLTNVATALRREPRLAGALAGISLMGGAWGLGNQTPGAEFNILVDPEAARVVFESGVPIVFHPLELTHQAKATPDVIARIEALGTPLARFVVEMLGFFAETYRRRNGFDGPPLHDPCAVAYVIDPSLFETRAVRVDVETHAEFSAGRTVVDLHGVLGEPPNATVATAIDAPRFWDLLVEALASYR